MMLAILDGELPEHPAIECLFTVEEETGLGGAEAFDYKKIDARRMINIDSESENEVTAGCAGGLISTVSYKLPTEDAEGEPVSLFVDGLFGGHSGVDINSGRKNAIMLTVEMLNEISAAQPIRLVSLNGGDKDNAIPRFCRAIFCADDVDAVRRAVKTVEDRVRPTLCPIDAGFTASVDVLQGEKKAFSVKDTRDLLGILNEVDVGVLKMSEHLEGLVEFSRNLGVIRINGESVNITYSPRSAKEEQLDLSIEQVERAAARVGAGVSHRSRYPGWDFAPESPLRELYIKKCREKLGKDIETVVIHAGLECGIIISRIPDMDAISIGPDALNIHTPNEALDLASTARVFEVLKAVLLG